MSPRKILILTNRIPYPLKDGGNLAMNAMIEGYYRAGWQVYLLSMNTSRHFIEEVHLKTLFAHLYRFDWVNINNDVTFPGLLKNYFFSREPEHAKRFYDESFKTKLINVLGQFRPDVVQVESVYLSTYLPEIDNAQALTILRLHNIEYQIWKGLAKKTRNPVKKVYLETLTRRIRDFERDAWKQYDLLLAITEKDAKLVARLEEINDIIVAPFSIDIGDIQESDRAERWVGYHIGAMDWLANKEGIKWFLREAWPKIRKAVPDFEFYFAGRNMPPELKRVNMKGVYCMDEVPSAQEFIADKKILIVPITSAGGIRVKILEAMAAGKVIISTSAGIKGIEARTGEHYLLARTPEDFAKSIKWCTDNREAAEKMAQRARNLVKEKYEYSVVINKVISEVEALLAMKK